MRINIIIPTIKLAGAEKRFVFMFMSLVEKRPETYLFITKELYQEAEESTEFNKIIQHKNNIVITAFKNGVISRYVFLNYFLKSYPTSINHFVLWFPIRLFYGQIKTLFTFPANDYKRLFPYYKRIIINYFFLKAKKVDLLDGNVFNYLTKRFKSFNQKFYLTPNSCINTDFFNYDKNQKKNNDVVFLGRFDDQKQSMRYLKQIPQIHTHLKQKGIIVNTYYLVGFGDREMEMKKELGEKKFDNIPVEILHTTNPELILRKSKVFLSLQQFNNYPSRALMEAMASGNLPIVTDVGTTKLLANETFAAFVPKNFDAVDIAKSIEAILSLPEKDFYQKAQLAREVILKDFTLEKMENYYVNLYDNI